MPNSQTLLVSFVIVNYNVREFVLEGIRSIYTNLNYDCQVILVDNNSTDGTVEHVKEQFSDVEIVANKKNLGFSAANNQAFEICKGDIIIMLNPDAAFVDGSVNILVEELLKEKDRSILMGPRIINPDGSFQSSSWKFPKPIDHLLELFFLNTIFDRQSYKSINWKIKTSVDSLSGACIAFTKSTLIKLKGLDENLFWMDDVDFCKRNLLAGGINWYMPQTNVKHYIGQSSKKNQRILISNQIISKLKFYRKHKLHFYCNFSIFLFTLQILTRIPLFLGLSIFRPIYFKKFDAYCYTFKKLYYYLLKSEQAVVL